MIPLPKLFVAIDTDSQAQAASWVKGLSPFKHDGVGLKLGYQYLYGTGFETAKAWAHDGWPLFCDLKLYDIPQTVRGAIAAIAKIKPDLLTVHAQKQTMQAAVKARDDFMPASRLLAVTVLTSMTRDDLLEDGIATTVEQHVLRRAKLAQSCGIDGVVASAQEAMMLRSQLGEHLLIVTPGIRLYQSTDDDQKRTVTPTMAREMGASALVVGRPITESDRPDHVVATILEHFVQ